MTHRGYTAYAQILEDLEKPDWQEQAACRGCDPVLWYSERGESQRNAAAVCMECPVREQCAEWALSRPECFGMWGGLSERARRRIRKARAATVKVLE